MKTPIRRITVSQRVRPVRLAFLVRPNDREALQRVFEINTCLWGGRYNCIIPAYRRPSTRWAEGLTRVPSGPDIIDGYISAFEPDFIVAMEQAPNRRMPTPHVISPDAVLDVSGEPNMGYGVSVDDLYRELYSQEIQYHRRDSTTFGIARADDSRLSALAAAVFGRFPQADPWKHIQQGYEGYFRPNTFDLTATAIRAVIAGEVATPLQVGSQFLTVHRRGWSHNPVLLLLNETNPLDIIDYWNLRAMGRRVYPVPVCFSDDLVECCKHFIARHNRPNRRKPDVTQETDIVPARSLRREAVDAFLARLPSSSRGCYRTSFYPCLWDQWARSNNGIARCTLEANSADSECSLEAGRITTTRLAPMFHVSPAPSENPAWVNVIRLRYYSFDGAIATVFPAGLEDPDHLFETMREYTRITNEGILVSGDSLDRTLHFRVPDGVAVHRAWLKGCGVDAQMSAAGRIVLQMIRQLRGPLGAQVVADANILHLLDQMAHGIADGVGGEVDNRGRKPWVRGRSVRRPRWWGELLKRNDNSKREAMRDLSRLTKYGILQVGLTVKCRHCTQTNWYSLREVSDSLRCERCLRKFRFPAANPPMEPWSYRTRGPFAIENYAQGAYASVLTLRALLIWHGHAATWAPSLDLSGVDGGRNLEIDFAIWWNRQTRDQVAPTLVLGECKSFEGTFMAKDVAKARVLAIRFPGAVLVFATLRPNLRPVERKMISALARFGRRSVGEHRWRAPVMVLTGYELMTTQRMPVCWWEGEGKMRDLMERFSAMTDVLELCEFTQRLYLDMKPDPTLRVPYFGRAVRGKPRLRRSSVLKGDGGA